MWDEILQRHLKKSREQIGSFLIRKDGNAFPVCLCYFACVAWFAEQDKYEEIFEINKRMTAWLIKKLPMLKDI